LGNRFIREPTQIKSINEIIATQNLESWFFYDIEGIYNFLRVPRNERNPHKYYNVESTNYRTLSYLFRKYNKIYLKGRSVGVFLKRINIQKIYNSCEDLRVGIERMIKLTE